MAREGVTITIGARIQDAINGLGRIGKAIGKFAAKWAALAGVAGGAATAFLALSTAINQAMEMEQALASLETLTGSLEVAQEKMKELVAFAQRTPLDLKGVQDTSRLLLATGTSTDDLMKRLEMLGDIASGTKQPINELGLVFSQVMNKGRLMAQDLNQFSERGVPLLTELASIYKVTAKEILTMGENGRISSEMVLYALKKMTAEGGRFYQAMAKQNETFAGKLNALKEIWLERLRDFGTPIVTALKPILTDLSAFLTSAKSMFTTAGQKVAEWITAAYEAMRGIFSRMPEFVWNVKIIAMEWAKAGNAFLQDVAISVRMMYEAGRSFFTKVADAIRAIISGIEAAVRFFNKEMETGAITGPFDKVVQELDRTFAEGADNLKKVAEYFGKNVEGLGEAVTKLKGAPPDKRPEPQMWGTSSMKKEGEKLGAPPSMLAPGQIFTDKEIAELERQAKGLGQMSGTAAQARTALRRAQRAQQQAEHGNIEEANRATRGAKESAARAAAQENRRKTRAGEQARSKAEGLRTGKGGFQTAAPESRFDPKTGKLRQPESAGASAKMADKPVRSEEAGFLASIEKILEKRLPEQTA